MIRPLRRKEHDSNPSQRHLTKVSIREFGLMEKSMLCRYATFLPFVTEISFQGKVLQKRLNVERPGPCCWFLNPPSLATLDQRAFFRNIQARLAWMRLEETEKIPASEAISTIPAEIPKQWQIAPVLQKRQRHSPRASVALQLDQVRHIHLGGMSPRLFVLLPGQSAQCVFVHYVDILQL